MKLNRANLVNTFIILFSRRPKDSSLTLLKQNLWKFFFISWAVLALLGLAWVLFFLALVTLAEPILGNEFVVSAMEISFAFMFIPMIFLVITGILLSHVDYKLAKNKLIAKRQQDEFNSNGLDATFKDRLLRFVEILPVLSLYAMVALVGLLVLHAALAQLFPTGSRFYQLAILTTNYHANLILFFFLATSVLFVVIVPFRLLFRRW